MPITGFDVPDGLFQGGSITGRRSSTPTITGIDCGQREFLGSHSFFDEEDNMKIEWLNEDCTEAIVTRGWFRKRRAHIKRDDTWACPTTSVWKFVNTGRWLSSGKGILIEDDVERARAKKMKRRAIEIDREWELVVKPTVPAMRVVVHGATGKAVRP
jgi:hypothetical protein